MKLALKSFYSFFLIALIVFWFYLLTDLWLPVTQSFLTNLHILFIPAFLLLISLVSIIVLDIAVLKVLWKKTKKDPLDPQQRIVVSRFFRLFSLFLIISVWILTWVACNGLKQKGNTLNNTILVISMSLFFAPLQIYILSRKQFSQSVYWLLLLIPPLVLLLAH